MRYAAPLAARLGRCSRAQLETWVRMGLVAPDDAGRFGFGDLVVLRVVGALLDAGLSSARVRRAVTFLLEAGEDVASLQLVTDGRDVWACRDDGQILDALRHGQLALFVAVDRFVDEVAADIRVFDAERDAFVATLAPISDARSTGPSGAASAP